VRTQGAFVSVLDTEATGGYCLGARQCPSRGHSWYFAKPSLRRRISALRLLLPLLAAMAAALALSACGGDEGTAASTGPVTMNQRVVSEADAPDSEPDPVETPVEVNGPDEFISKLGERFVNPTQEEVENFRKGGFVRALHVTRFIPATQGGPHSRDLPHIFSLVMQFDSAQGAKDALETLHLDSLRPCPETCGQSVEEFDVPDISGAFGTHRSATAESIQQAGDTEGHPFDEYQIGFADGVFAYRIILSGNPGKVTQDEAEEIAKSLYDRVKGQPPA
jgi:hypothetical protein